MSQKTKTSLAMIIGFMLFLWAGPAKAQEKNGWSAPYRLSSLEVEASEGFIAADPYGFVHSFWVETDPADNRSVIQHARFDGAAWSTPVDIYAASPGIPIGFLAPSIDHNAAIHLAWTEGYPGTNRILVSDSSASSSPSAHNWSPPSRLDLPANWIRLQVDSSGVLHLVYSIFYSTNGNQPGVYHTRSEDGGITWSNPYWLDPDIPNGEVPHWLQFGLDETDGLHVVWNYLDPDEEKGQAVRYAHSLDGGNTWSVRTLDEPDETGTNLRMANPSMLVFGQKVYAVWGASRSDVDASGNILRRYRYSLDAGRSWSEPRWLLDNLNGMSLGDGLAADAAGRIHFVLTVRYPVAIWHTYWDEDRWVVPSMAYFIALDSEEQRVVKDTNARIRAHNVRLAIRRGNQLVMTFTSVPGEGPLALYAMHHTLDDVVPVPVLTVPTPTPVVTPTPETLAAPTARPIQMPGSVSTVPAHSEAAISDTSPELFFGLWFSLLPVLIVVGSAAAIQWVRRR